MSFPKYLYRFFKEKEHRDQFFDGLIRFRHIKDYGKISHFERQDPDEGKGAKGRYRTDIQTLTIDKNTNKMIESEFNRGDMNITGESLNKHFICSLSDENVDLKEASKRFGKYAIKIYNIQKFIDLLNQNNTYGWSVGKIQLVKVIYDRGQNISIEKNNILCYEYFIAQKREAFSKDCEWRLVIVGDVIREINENPKIIDVASLGDIASIIDL